jgi:O-Antigen ligase
MRDSVRAACAAVLIAGPTALAFFSGGFFDRPRLLAGVVAWALVIVAAAAGPLPASTPARLAALGLALLTAWTALSLTWAPLGGRAQDDLQRLLLYLGFFLAALALLRGPTVRRWLEPSLVLGSLVVVGYALSERLLPGLVELDRSRTAMGRLEQPLSYWNALGALAAVGLVLAARVAGDPRRGTAIRACATAAAVPIGLGLYLTFSRAALAAAAIGLLVLIALAPAGRPQVRAAVTIVACAAAAALVASALPTVESVELGEQGDSGEGAVMLVAICVLAAVAAALVTRPARWRIAPRLPVPRGRAVAILGVAALLAGGTAVAAIEGGPEATSPQPGANPSRLGSIDTDRYEYWRVALESWVDRPLAGLGSGGFRVEWLREPDRIDPSGDAHSLYLETAAELGLVGLALLGIFVGGVAVGAVRLQRLDPAAGAGIAAGLVVLAFHAGLDWDWEMPALSLVGLLLAAAATVWSVY